MNSPNFSKTSTFENAFRTATRDALRPGGCEPYGCQHRLAEDAECKSGLTNISAGLGKIAVVLAWRWNRVLNPNVKIRSNRPRRPVYGLPMRTLTLPTAGRSTCHILHENLSRTTCPARPQRPSFQRILGNVKADILLAKSGKEKQPFALKEDYRHEFSSLLDVENEDKFKELTGDMKDLVLRLIAAHHGRGRPHFPMAELDPERDEQMVCKIASDVPQRYARIQRKYGHWGLAYLESLLRAADWAASANLSAFLEDDQ